MKKDNNIKVVINITTTLSQSQIYIKQDSKKIMIRRGKDALNCKGRSNHSIYNSLELS